MTMGLDDALQHASKIASEAARYALGAEDAMDAEEMGYYARRLEGETYKLLQALADMPDDDYN